MHLTEFIILSHDEILKNTLLLTLIGEYEHENRTELQANIISLIRETDPSILIKLSLINPIVDALCKNEHLSNHWQEIWYLCGCQQSTRTPGYLPQPTIDCFDLIKSIYLYWQYCVEIDDNPVHAETYLQKSMELGCYLAMNSVCKIKLNNLQSKIVSSDMDKLLLIARKASQLHWTPGYLLLANVLIQLASIMKNNHRYPMSMVTHCNALYASALQALYVAEYLQAYSSSSIHNAYDGKLLSEVYQDTDLTNLQCAQNKIKQISNTLMQNDSYIKQKAENEFHDIVSKYALDISSAQSSPFVNTLTHDTIGPSYK